MTILPEGPSRPACRDELMICRRLSKKVVIPHLMRSFFEREAKSPVVDIGRRCQPVPFREIGVRHDEIDYVFAISRTFWIALKKV